MEERIALLSIIVENPNSTETMNQILHEYAPYIIGRMGIPYPKRHVALISIALDAPVEVMNALSGKLGKIDGLTTKVVLSKYGTNH